jgi:tight adherence protein C
MAILLSAALFLILSSVIALYGYRAYVRPARFFEQLSAPGSLKQAAKPMATRTSAARVMGNIGATVPVSKEDATVARRYLTAAGFRSERALSVYYGMKVTMCAMALTGALFLVPHIGSRIIVKIFLCAVSTSVGYYSPNLFLERMVMRRQRRLRIGLPDALDLLVIAVESGLGLDQALVSVTRELRHAHKDVTDEFMLVSLEMRAGKRRIDALNNLSLRTGEPEVKKLVAVLAQTDRFGTSVSDALRTHADFMRVTRRLSAEERAGKLGVKLTFPIFFFILPSLALVVAGPGLLQVARVLLPTLRNVK